MRSRWLLLQVVVVLVACDEPVVDEVVVGAIKDPRRCETCLTSKRDNPPVKLTASLGSSKGPNGEDLAEYAERNALGVVFNNVKLDLFVKGDDAKGAPSMNELRPLPATPGTWQAVPGQPPIGLPLEIRGIELGYANSEAQLVHANS